MNLMNLVHLQHSTASTAGVGGSNKLCHGALLALLLVLPVRAEAAPISTILPVVPIAVQPLATPLGPSLASCLDGDDGLVLTALAAELSVTHRGRKTDGGSIDRRITPPLRIALNKWAAAASNLDLRVAVPESAEALVIGSLDTKAMNQVTEVLDETWELLEPLMSEETRQTGDAVLVLLFDKDGFHSEAWPLMLDELVSCGLIDRSTRSHLRATPGGLTIFSGKMFIQPSFDQAGDAAAGDDEFRLDNELAHKLTVSLVRSRFGQVPECVRWGMGFVAEQRLFQSIFQFNRAGFVAVEEHFGWPEGARDELKKLKKKKQELSLADMVTNDGSAGQRQPPQLLTWGALDYLLDREPEVLSQMLTELADLHDAGAGFRAVSSYAGELDATKSALEKHLGDLDAKSLEKHLKRVK